MLNKNVRHFSWRLTLTRNSLQKALKNSSKRIFILLACKWRGPIVLFLIIFKLKYNFMCKNMHLIFI